MIATIPVLSNQNPPISIIRKVEEPKPQPEQVTVEDGMTLTSIAVAHNTTPQRLFNKNLNIDNPDVIKPGDVIVVPLDSDTLPERAMISTSTQVGMLVKPENSPSGSFSVSGNFVFGWCTYYADQQRPDIHATGNASDWIRYANSSEPRVGAVAVNTFAAGGLGHVGIVVDFNATQVLVRSMNFHKFGVVTTDWVDRGYWAGYIL